MSKKVTLHLANAKLTPVTIHNKYCQHQSNNKC